MGPVENSRKHILVVTEQVNQRFYWTDTMKTVKADVYDDV